MSRRQSIAFTLALAALLCGPTEASAQSPAATPSTANDPADVAFRKGNALYKQQQYAEAKVAFEEAFRLKKSHDIAANLAYAEMKLGQHRDAAEHLAFAVKNWPPTGKSENRESAARWLGVAKAAVATLEVTVSVDGAGVLVDGKLVGTSPLEGELFVEPGSRTIEARLPGYLAAQQMVQATKGGQHTIRLALERDEGPYAQGTGPAKVPSEVPQRRRSVVPGAVLGGVAGVALATGIGLFAAGRAKVPAASDLHDSIFGAGRTCATGEANYDARCEDLRGMASTGNTLQRAGVGLMIGAGAAAAATVIYFVVPMSSAGPAAPSSLRVAPAFSLGTGGLMLSGTF